MKLAYGELHSLGELALSCVNTITNMAMYKNCIADPELKNIVESHFQLHIQDYNMKVKFIKEANGPTEKLTVPSLKSILKDFTKSPISPSPITPRTTVEKLNDREIATGYLLTLKRAGREYAWSAMEASNPVLRDFFKSAFEMAYTHSYEIWQWMVQKGFYALSPAPENEIAAMGSFYNEIQQ